MEHTVPGLVVYLESNYSQEYPCSVEFWVLIFPGARSLGVTLHTGALSGGEDGHSTARGHSTGTHGLWPHQALHGHSGNQRAAVCGGFDSDL